jgi:subfamily B ATP-binding cassette protein MsbA
MRLILTRGLANPVVQLLSSLGLAFVLSIAISEAIHHNLTTRQLIAFFAGLINIAQPLRALVNVAAPLQQGFAAGQNLFELLDETPEDRGGSRDPAMVRGEVEFRHVSFTYGSGKGAALHDVSFTAKAGETVAIVGRSGSGKSTLVNLLPRFYDPTSGSVHVDGVDAREYALRGLRDRMALVTQEVVLFNDTIRNNIAFGREASPEAVERAAAAAHVLEFAQKLPEGLDAVVGDRGVQLSGGQRQRIAIARALLKDAPILILDEATSALDTESERIIQAELEELMHHRTTLVIAHRLSTVEKANRIVVLDGGRLVESGTHAQLLALGGLYAQLHRMQFKD